MTRSGGSLPLPLPAVAEKPDTEDTNIHNTLFLLVGRAGIEPATT